MDLEKEAYLLSETLNFHAAILQESYNGLQEREAGKPSYHYFKGCVKDAAEECLNPYRKAKELLQIAEIFNLGDIEESPEEEVRMFKEKYFSSNINNSYSGDVGEAMKPHNERKDEAYVSDTISNGTGFHELRSSVSQYEELVRKMSGIQNQIADVEIVEETTPKNDIAEIDRILGQDL